MESVLRSEPPLPTDPVQRCNSWRALLALLALSAACAPATARRGGAIPATDTASAVVRAEPMQRLEAALHERIGRDPQGSVGFVAIDLATGLRVEINANESMHAASTMKVPIMIEVFRQVAAGRTSLQDSLPVIDTFRSIVGDSAYTLTPAVDSDSALYERIGGRATVRDLIQRMITRSSNLATNILIGHVPADSVMHTQRRIGAAGMRVLRGVEDGPAFRAGLSNTTTADAFATTLEAIARCVVNRPEHCAEMMDILAMQEFDDGIPAGLPPGTRVAHKTGWITGIQHDGAIVQPPGRPGFVVVVLTRGFTDREQAARLQADLARIVWDAWSGDALAALPSIDPETRSILTIQLAHRIDALAARHVRPDHFWTHAAPRAGSQFRVEEAGRSLEDRPIRLLSWGTGPVPVLLWSQMHGDESTATMALADLIRFLDDAPGDARVSRWRDAMTLHLVPMLNPDGAERFVRHNAVGIDINRDARQLATPEGRTLKSVHDRIRPAFGFNLHDQNPRTRVGASSRRAGIALLAPPFDSTRSENAVRLRAKNVASAIRSGIEPLIGGYIARYDDSFNPRAFGDLTTQWGTSTVLIESGGLDYDPQKQFLRAVNFVALVRALDVIASGGWEAAGAAPYETLPENGRALNDLLISGGSIVLPGRPPVRADIAADHEDAGGRRTTARITEIGDLSGLEARDTLVADGLFLHPLPQPDASGPPVAVLPRMIASFAVRRGADPASEAVWIVEAGFVRRAAAQR
jgi:beta-lactamase class A